MVHLPGWSLALCMVVAPLRIAAAAPAEGAVLVATPVVRGADGTPTETSVAAALQTGVGRAQLPVIAADEAGACEDAACHVEAGKRAGAAYVAATRVDVTDRDYAIRMSLIDVATGEVRELKEDCTICGLDDACRVIESMGSRLGPLWQAAREEAAAKQALARSLQEQPLLRVVSAPAGATVFVDGEKIGTTPVEHRVTSGRHLVEVERADYIRERREIDVVRGSTGELRLDLRAAGKLPPSPRSRAALISGSVLLGVGAAGLGVMAYGIGRGAALERQGADMAAELMGEGLAGLELTDALADTRARGQRANTLGVVGGVIGGVLVISGATLVALSTSNRLRRVAVAPWGWRGLAGLTLSGRF